MSLVEIGLQSAKEGFRADGDDTVVFRPVPDLRVLEVRIPDGDASGDAFRTITDPQGVVAHHTDSTPSWVHSDDLPALAALLAEHYACVNGKPADVEDTHWTVNGPPGVGPSLSEHESSEVSEAVGAD